ncbi:F-box/LRR-repeat protein 4 [Sebastes umbrosus]|uniref:F-box/LRR-repeat protein 4 n=1 Tax=Sebastes umbrosus TaxID=72105 RepID=UPI0018A010FB|nr:F-box/LRR-repeat protein 4 [Sebastes umbrosus]XP_037635069.1 F-box/LRR-repeat protein 4 [Sebastes umbrosus]
MPLFRALGEHGGGFNALPERRRRRRKRMGNMEWMGSCGKTDENGSVLSLTRLCLLSLVDNMKEVWVKDYADNYLDHYSFRYIIGPFSLLPGELVEQLIWLLCTRKQMSRAALHLLLVPQLRGLSLERCPGLVTSALCAHIAARCQGLRSLDLSGAQQLPSKVLIETLGCLPALRSLSLAGTPCDRFVIRTIARRCLSLRHLDISRCHSLPPAALLPLGGGTSFPSSDCPSRSPRCTSASQSCISSSCSEPLPPLPLSSLLALDIGFGEQEGDPVAAAAYLLLSLPCLERVAMEGLAQACCLIEHQQFGQTDEFTDREGVPRLGEVWRERRQSQGMDGWRKKREGVAADEEDEEDEKEEEILWEGYGSDGEDDASRDEGPSCTQNQAEEKMRGRGTSGDERLILRLKDIKGLSCDSLDSLSRACPNVCSVSVNLGDCENTTGRSQGSVLAAGFQAWSGQLRSLSVHYPGPLVDLLPASQVAGSSLVSLTLEGVKTSTHTPLLEVIRACPRLRDLLISAEPPTTPQEEEEEDEEDQRDDRDLPQLPDLCSLTLNFSYEHSQRKPVMSWMSLKRVLKYLLTGSPLLEELSLVSLPCPLNCVLQNVLDSDLYLSAESTDSPPMPLGQVQRIVLPRTDVEIATVKSIMRRSKRVKYVDVSYCLQISRRECLACETSSGVQVVWLQ